MANDDYTQALIDLGAAAKRAQDTAQDYRKVNQELREALNITEKQALERYEKIYELKKDLASQEAKMSLERRDLVNAYEQEARQLKDDNRKLEEQKNTISNEYATLWKRYRFARNFITKNKLGRAFGWAMRREITSNNG
jgi:chromosome segregation ATPase